MKIIIAIVLIVTGVFLSGCGSTQHKPTANETFLAVIHQQSPAFKSVPNSQVINLAHMICKSFDNGLDVTTIAMSGIESGMTVQQTGTLMGAAVAAYCPKYNHVFH